MAGAILLEARLNSPPLRCNLQQRGAERRTGFGGAAVSSLYQEEMIREEDKNIFDYCRENNIEHIRNAISSQKVDVNSKDEEGRALLHWACDRGHKELVSVLLQHKADINSQVSRNHLSLCLSLFFF
ncbi:acyl-CoA binding domain-containing protein 6 [Ameca splendens]|uniref:Acyl-CoA binding domain-containing protein 6 n=1 Tax=Ameca splendens TaxID=208324 RepID=A0ABV0XN07_9TELE